MELFRTQFKIIPPIAAHTTASNDDNDLAKLVIENMNVEIFNLKQVLLLLREVIVMSSVGTWK